MTAFPSYATGTVSVNSGDTTIVGSGTIWSGVNARPGDDIVIAGHTVIIQDVVDATHITIDAWPYSNVTAGSAYKIVQRSPLRFAGGQAMADVSALVAALNATGFFFFVDISLSVPDPSLGSDGQYAFQPGTSKLWTKIAGVWTLTSFPNAVSYATAQSLTAAQQAQARANINVQKKNYIINGGMMVSQENGSTAGTTANYYPVDQWRADFSNAGAVSVAQVAGLTPGGSPNRIRVTVTSADASVGASDYLALTQRIEGARVADLRFGAASAKQITVQLGVKGPAGTYCIGLRNGTPNRCYVGEFTIAGGEANTDVVKSVTLTGDTTGTWATDNTIGLELFVTLMAGSSFQTSAGSWIAASSVFATSNQFNLMGTNGNVFELFDVGIYEGPVAPAFQLPHMVEELMACKRHFYKGTPPARGLCASTSAISRVGCMHPVPMRAAPTLSFAGNVGVTDGAVAVGISSITNNYSDTDKFEIDATVTASTLTANRIGMLYTSTGSLSVSARM